MTWSPSTVPELAGRCIVVTGANSGLGFETARALARKGAELVMACRDVRKAEQAEAKIRAEQPSANVTVRALDLGSLASVRAFAARFAAEHAKLDVLVNNAGVMAIPRTLTSDGFEMQLGVNHFGHFALTGLLFDKLLAAP
ncbi:MAG TPA: SDR family NAD(P)-dependent oxidoreductase, partial [Polyangiales bacterium]|nr:SDR family NAD(P)-dependent oxidoreductase [Polyangiales bacterium]